MSLSRRKGSGKTYRFHDGDCSICPTCKRCEKQADHERIAELEAELRTECVHCGQPIPHVHKHESTRELALRLRAEKAEAELAEKDKTLKRVTFSAANTIAALSGEVKDYLMRVEREKARAEKAEAEVERLKAQRDHWWELVERAKLLLPGWPPEGGGGRESGEEPPEAGCSEPAAAEPAARKERDEG